MTRDSCTQVLPPSDHCFHSRTRSLTSSHLALAVPGAYKGNWTREENKLFENALAHFEGDCQQVADAIPGKTAWEVMAHYRDLVADVTKIEAGLDSFPGTFDFSGFTLNWGWVSGLHKYRDRNHQSPYFCGGKHPPAANAKSVSDQERKKGVPWTQEEHRLFLLGLNKYGKGDWRNISRNVVLTRTPTQVASHAQKYFNRLNSGNKDKRRPSIHDITTTNLPA